MPEYDKPEYLKLKGKLNPLDPMIQTRAIDEVRPADFNKHPSERKKLFGEKGV